MSSAMERMSSLTQKENSMIRQMRKPTAKRKRIFKKVPKAELISRGGRGEVTGLSLKSGELDKKIDALIKANLQLKDRKEALCSENEGLKLERNAMNIERDRVLQFWQSAENELQQQQQYASNIERMVHDMKTAHSEQVALLNKRLRALALKSRLHCVRSTQTDVIIEAGEVASTEAQTVGETTKEPAAEILKNEETQLAKQIAELVKDKLQAQSELKFATVQLEQRMREKHEKDLRRLKEEKERELEKITVASQQQINEIEKARTSENDYNNERIKKLQKEMRLLNEKLEKCEKELRICEGDKQRLKAENRILTDENTALHRDVEKNKLESKRRIEDATLIRELKEKLAKSEDIREIILGEFRKLEAERDDLIKALSNGIRKVYEVNQRKSRILSDEIAYAERSIEAQQ